MRIIGVDPGLLRTGYGCVEWAARGVGRASATPGLRVAAAAGEGVALVEAGVIRLPARRATASRLVELERDLTEIIDRLRPEAAAVEGLFTHYERPSTAVAMGHARGVILLVLARAGLEITEHQPKRVKKSLTGNGAASKRQVQLAVQAQLRLREPPSPPDVADAIAVAMCAARNGAGFGASSGRGQR